MSGAAGRALDLSYLVLAAEVRSFKSQSGGSEYINH